MPSDLGGIPVYINNERDSLFGHAELFGDERSKTATIVITCAPPAADDLAKMLADNIPLGLSFEFEPAKRESPKFLVRQVREVLVEAPDRSHAANMGRELLKKDAAGVRIRSLEVYKED